MNTSCDYRFKIKNLSCSGKMQERNGNKNIKYLSPLTHTSTHHTEREREEVTDEKWPFRRMKGKSAKLTSAVMLPTEYERKGQSALAAVRGRFIRHPYTLPHSIASCCCRCGQRITSLQGYGNIIVREKVGMQSEQSRAELWCE